MHKPIFRQYWASGNVVPGPYGDEMDYMPLMHRSQAIPGGHTNKVFPLRRPYPVPWRYKILFFRKAGMELHHITDSDLERYYVGVIGGMELAMLDEHLLWCISCGHRLSNVGNPDARDQGCFVPIRYPHEC